MTTSKIILIAIWCIVAIELIYLIIRDKKKQLLNHKPTYDYQFENVFFRVKEITYEDYGLSKYKISIEFFKKSNARGWIYKEFYFYDKTGKYNVGDRLFLNRNKENVN